MNGGNYGFSGEAAEALRLGPCALDRPPPSLPIPWSITDVRVCITRSVWQGCKVGGTGVQRSTGAAMKQVNQVGVDVDSKALVCDAARGTTAAAGDVCQHR